MVVLASVSKPPRTRTPLRAELLEGREVPAVVDIFGAAKVPGCVAPREPGTGEPNGPRLLEQHRYRYAVGSAVAAQVNVYDARTNALMGIISPFGANTRSGISLATGDVTGDGIEDIVVASGRGGQPFVKVFDGATLAERVSFLAYSKTFLGGVSVALGDINGDGRSDIVVGAGVGSAPQVKVFSGQEIFSQPYAFGNTNPKAIRNFFAFDIANRAGISIAVGDVDGDRREDIIVGTGAGENGRIRCFSGKTDAVVTDFQVGATGDRSGVNVAAGDINNDGRVEIVAGQAGGGSTVRVFTGSTQIATYSAFPGTAGVRVATEDVHGDGNAEVIVTVAGGPPRIRILSGLTGEILRDFPGFVPSHNEGLAAG